MPADPPASRPVQSIDENVSMNASVAVAQSAPPSAETKGDVTFDPVQEQGAECGASTAGCSTAVSPINTFIPTIKDALPFIGIAAQIIAMLGVDEDKDYHQEFEDHVTQTIDNNDYLPTTYDDYRQWDTIARNP